MALWNAHERCCGEYRLRAQEGVRDAGVSKASFLSGRKSTNRDTEKSMDLTVTVKTQCNQVFINVVT